uniref:Activating transcription factor 3 n=1 Tax=Bos indicus x Bos taurus TaxID=30522 RepID=A0A4W2IC88_BOBOX
MQRAASHSRTQRGAHCIALTLRRRPSGPASPRAGREPLCARQPTPQPASQPDPTPTLPALRTLAAPSGYRSKMMLQHPGQVSASEEELRLAIQSKHLCHRMSSALDSVTVSGRPLEMSVTKAEVAPEEDERKKRRRERNKIAAAKCRNKKKEKTECLQKESEKLESVNAELKAQIEELKNEKQHLIYMLNLHRPTCIVRAQNGRTPEDERNLFIQQIKEGTLQS